MDSKLVSLINRRQRQIMVHSYIYYHADTNLIEDHVYDAWSKELAELIVNHPQEFKESAYYQSFKNYDGSTGMDLPYRSPEIVKVANMLLNYKHEQ